MDFPFSSLENIAPPRPTPLPAPPPHKSEQVYVCNIIMYIEVTCSRKPPRTAAYPRQGSPIIRAVWSDFIPACWSAPIRFVGEARLASRPSWIVVGIFDRRIYVHPEKHCFKRELSSNFCYTCSNQDLSLSPDIFSTSV
jgi:hypothetical protein